MDFLNGLFGSKKQNQQNMTEEAAKVFANTGMIDPRVYNPNIRFQSQTNPIQGMEYATAYVPRANPNIVNLVEPRFQNLFSNPLASNTLTHELEHSLAYTGGAELNKTRNRGDVFLDNYVSLVGKDANAYKTFGSFLDNASNRNVGKHLEKNYGVKTNYLGASGADPMMQTSDYEELVADLGTAMKTGKKDVFSDPFLQKYLFNNDPYLMEAVRSTLNVEPRMDAKDLPRLTAQPKNVQRFQKLINMNKPDENVFYQDPFGVEP
jgi:hypothetical protein